jgi:8-oxo-dGTP pyrophosphatase MutT (NUDIX family)
MQVAAKCLPDVQRPTSAREYLQAALRHKVLGRQLIVTEHTWPTYVGASVHKVVIMADDESTRWIIHGERVVDDTRKAQLSIASVELPDGVRFEQYVIRAPRAAMMLVLDDDDRALMMRRHRFILDRWVWELPGGYVDPGEDPAETAVRECAEETGWRPRSVEPLISFQPMVGTVDSENLLFLGRGADPTGAAVDVNEAQEVGWVPLSEIDQRIEAGEIVGSASVIGLYRARDVRRSEGSRL